MKKLIPISIILVPLAALIPIHGSVLWYPQWLMLFCLMVIGLSLPLMKVDKLFVYFIWYCLFSYLIPAQTHPKALIQLIMILFSAYAVYCIAMMDDVGRKKIFKALKIVIVLQILFGILQVFNIDPCFDKIGAPPGTDDFVGLSGSHNQIGLFFSTMAPMVTLLFPIALPFCLAGVVLSNTIVCIAATGAGFISLYALHKKSRVLIFIFICVASLFLLKGGISLAGDIAWGEVYCRKQIIKHCFKDVLGGKGIMQLSTLQNMDRLPEEKDQAHAKRIKDSLIYKEITCNPFFGFGLGNFMRISPYTQWRYLPQRLQLDVNSNSHRYEHAHNDYAEIFYEMGIIGFVLMMIWFVDLLKRMFRLVNTKEVIAVKCAFIAFCVNALGIYTIHTAFGGMLFIILVGLIYSYDRSENVLKNPSVV